MLAQKRLVGFLDKEVPTTRVALQTGRAAPYDTDPIQTTMDVGTLFTYHE